MLINASLRNPRISALPLPVWRIEAAQVAVDATRRELWEIDTEARALFDDPDITPEKVVALCEKLQSATGSAVAV